MFITSKSIQTDTLEFIKKFGNGRQPPNTKVSWYSTDSYTCFQKHLQNKKSNMLLKTLGWTDSNVEYRFNNFGFRTDDDFDLENPKPGLLIVGCSIAEGVGINLEDMWAYKICQRLGYKCYNLAQAGCGIETQYRLIKAWAPVLKPAAILSQGSWNYRYEFICNSWPYFLTLGVNEIGYSASKFYEHVLIDETNNELMTARTYDAIKNITTELDIPFYELDPDTHKNGQIQYNITGQEDYGRDLSHPGKMYNVAVANKFYELISNTLQK